MAKGFSLVELLIVLVVVALIGALVGWAFLQGRDGQRAAALVDLAVASRAAAVAHGLSSAAAGVNDSGGVYAQLGNDWLLSNLDPRYVRGGALAVPVPGVGVEVSGVVSPWGVTPPASLDVGRVRLTTVPREMCPDIVNGLNRNFDRVLINSQVALDTGLAPVAQTQILTWCNAAPVLTIEAFFA